jgi:hypothetical protein
MTEFNAVKGGSLASTSTHPAASAIVIKLMIEEGRLDEYLKSIFESVKDRKSKLSSSGGITAQCDPFTVDLTDAVVVNNAPLPVAAPAAARTKTSGSWKAKPVVFQRPSPDTPVFQGRIYSITDGEASSHDAKDIVVIQGKAYLKSDIVGKYFHHSVSNGNSVRAKIIGIGPKMIKFLFVDEPDQVITAKENWHASWLSNTPMFLPHSSVLPQWF